jgi:hypothetical protein
MDLKGIIRNLNRDTMSSIAQRDEEIYEQKTVEPVCRSIFEPNIAPVLAKRVTATQASSVTTCNLTDWRQCLVGTC